MNRKREEEQFTGLGKTEDLQDTYDYHRNNSRQMTDEAILRNMPPGTLQSNWAQAMRDEAIFRGLITEPAEKGTLPRIFLKKSDLPGEPEER